MASRIYTGLMLFALLHLGMTYTIWGPRTEQDATLNAMLDVYKSVKNSGSSNMEELSKLLASELLALYKQVAGVDWSGSERLDNEYTAISEMVNILTFRKEDPKLTSAEKHYHTSSGLYSNYYTFFLASKSSVKDFELFMHEALKLDNDGNYEHSQSMARFFQLFASEVPKTLSNYYERFPSTRALLNELLKYNERNEWELFMMVTSAYRLKSLENNDDSYVKEFNRLKKQLMDKLALHEDKFYEALGVPNSQRL